MESETTNAVKKGRSFREKKKTANQEVAMETTKQKWEYAHLSQSAKFAPIPNRASWRPGNEEDRSEVQKGGQGGEGERGRLGGEGGRNG